MVLGFVTWLEEVGNTQVDDDARREYRKLTEYVDILTTWESAQEKGKLDGILEYLRGRMEALVQAHPKLLDGSD